MSVIRLFGSPARIALVAVIAVLVGACSNGTTSSSSSGGGTVRVGYEADTVSLDPAQVVDLNSFQSLVQIYDTLVKWDTSGKLAPSLATKWTASPDGKTYTFDLRSGVEFSNGDPFSADAVVFTYERQIDKNNPGYQFGPFPFAGVFNSTIGSVKALSSTQVEFDLTQPDAGFLAGLTLNTGYIVDPKVALAEGKDFANTGAGTGPFMLDKWTRGQELDLKPNPRYWGSKPKLSKLVFLPITTPAQRTSSLESSGIDLAINPEPATLTDLKSRNFVVSEAPGDHIWFIGLNLSKPPFSNQLVRQAVNYAVDKNAIVSGVLHGTGIPANQPLTPGQLGFNKNLNDYGYDVQKAKQLLAQAGYPNGFSTTMIVPTSGSGMQDPVAMGTAIQGYLAAVGIKVTITQQEWGTYTTTVPKGTNAGGFDMYELSINDLPLDPWPIFAVLLSTDSLAPNGFNAGYYQDPQFESLIAQARSELDLQKRDALYQQAEAIVNQQAPWIFVDHENGVMAYSQSVRNFSVFKPFPLLLTQLQGVSKS